MRKLELIFSLQIFPNFGKMINLDKGFGAMPNTSASPRFGGKQEQKVNYGSQERSHN